MAQNALTMKLKLEQIVRDPDVQARITVYENTVLEYMEALERGEVFPPVTVFDDKIETEVLLGAVQGWKPPNLPRLGGKGSITYLIVRWD